ncbi:MAG: DUF3138 family protein, partial [Burkholderiales bacterium]|nr:DUF3138 family protein [Burkholderiales bacterium]
MKNSTLSRLIALSFSALPVVAYAQSNAPVTKNNHTEIAQELSRLQQRISELENAIKDKESQGMNPEQERELNRLSVLTDAQVDTNAAMGFKGLKISGYIDPTYIATRNQHRAGFQFLNSSTTAAGAPEFAFD